MSPVNSNASKDRCRVVGSDEPVFLAARDQEGILYVSLADRTLWYSAMSFDGQRHLAIASGLVREEGERNAQQSNRPPDGKE